MEQGFICQFRPQRGQTYMAIGAANGKMDNDESVLACVFGTKTMTKPLVI